MSDLLSSMLLGCSIGSELVVREGAGRPVLGRFALQRGAMTLSGAWPWAQNSGQQHVVLWGRRDRVGARMVAEERGRGE